MGIRTVRKQTAARLSALAISKTINEVEPLIFVKDDLDAKRLLVAWTRYKPAFKDLQVSDNPKPEDAFFMLWSVQETVDFDRLGKIAGLPYLLTCRLFHRLRMNHLVYPDGSVSGNARVVIHAEMQTYLKELYAQANMPDLKKEIRAGPNAAIGGA